MSWFQTHARVAFDLAAPSAAMVRAADIAHPSALLCRFNGHTRQHWPIAQHAVMVAAAAWHKTRDPITAAIGLLHDGAEPYIGDISAPMKWLLEVRAPGVLKKIEADVRDAVCDWAQIPRKPRTAAEANAAPEATRAWQLVRELDYRALFHDRDHMLGEPLMSWAGDGELEPEPLGPADVGAQAGDEVWNPLTTPWTAPVAESVFNYALSVLVPLKLSDRRSTTAHSYPPSWLIQALRRVLPRPPVGL